MAERLFYVERWSDEFLPCKPTLAAWAEWLATTDSEWGRQEAAADGERFAVDILALDDDVIVRWHNNQWAFSREIGDADLVAVRFGEGMGWDADSIMDGEAGLIEWLDDLAADEPGPHYIAVGRNEPGITCIFRAGPPPSLIEDATS